MQQAERSSRSAPVTRRPSRYASKAVNVSKCVDMSRASGAHDLLGQPPEAGLGRGMRVEIPVSLHGLLEATPASERGQRRKEQPLGGLRRSPEAHLFPVARREQRPGQRRRVSPGVRVPVRAEPPEDEDCLLEPASSVRSWPSARKVIRPCSTSKCSLMRSWTCCPPGTKPPSSMANRATILAPSVSSADSRISAFSPVNGFQHTSPARTGRSYSLGLSRFGRGEARAWRPPRSRGTRTPR